MKNLEKINIPALTAFLTLIPFFGYFIAFVFELTVFGLLGIPVEFVQINISLILLVSVILIFLSSLVIILSIFFAPILNKHKNSLIIYPLVTCLIIITITTIFLTLFGLDKSKNIISISFLLISTYLIYTYLFPFVKFRTFRNYRKHILEIRNKKVSDKKSFKAGNNYVILALILILSLLCMFGIVNVVAGAYITNFNNYLTFNKGSINYAIIRKYDDEFIAVEYKRDLLIPNKVYMFKSNSIFLVSKKLKLASYINSNYSLTKQLHYELGKTHFDLKAVLRTHHLGPIVF